MTFKHLYCLDLYLLDMYLVFFGFCWVVWRVALSFCVVVFEELSWIIDYWRIVRCFKRRDFYSLLIWCLFVECSVYLYSGFEHYKPRLSTILAWVFFLRLSRLWSCAWLQGETSPRSDHEWSLVWGPGWQVRRWFLVDGTVFVAEASRVLVLWLVKILFP